jgi:hypothetical protein
MVTNSENRGESHYFHASVPEHKADLNDQATHPKAPGEGTGEKVLPMQGLIFINRQTRQLLDALGNPNHPNRREAQQAIRGFTRAVARKTEEKPQGISINAAAREFNVPENFLWRWSRQRSAIPIVAEGIGSGSPTYLSREKAQEVAEIYHEAKRLNRQPKKLLEEKYPDLFRPPSK